MVQQPAAFKQKIAILDDRELLLERTLDILKLTRVDWALQGLTHTKDIKSMQSALEFKPEWLTVLTLAFQEGLPDKAIAERMCVSEWLVRHYWTKVQDVLDVYPHDGKNMRIQTEIQARKEGVLD